MQALIGQDAFVIPECVYRAGMTGVTKTLTMMVFGFRLRSRTFEATARVKHPALPEDIC